MLQKQIDTGLKLTTAEPLRFYLPMYGGHTDSDSSRAARADL